LLNILFLLFLYPCISAGQSSHYKFDHVTAKGVMATFGTVNYIYKDSMGFMWFGTSKGLQRFDGYQVKNFRDYPKDTANIVSRLVNTIYEDDRENLWVGTNRQGLLLFDRKTERFTSFRGDPEDPHGIPETGIQAIYQDKRGSLWFGVVEGGLQQYDYASRTFSRYLLDTLVRKSGKNNVFAILEDRLGNLWCSTGDGVFLFNRDEKSFIPVELRPKLPDGFSLCLSLMEDQDGNIWIGSNWGVYSYNPSNDEWRHFFPDNSPGPKTLSSQYIRDIREYSNGNRREVWIATTWGLNKYEPATGTFTHLFHRRNDPHSLRNDLSSGLYIDANGLLWTASGGASTLDLNQNHFTHYPVKTRPDSLYDLSVTSFCETRDGHYWIGGYDDGVFEYDRSLRFINNYKPTVRNSNRPDTDYRNTICCIYEDSQNNLWVSTLRFSVNIFDRKKKKFETVPFYFPEGYGEPYDIEEILEDHFGVLWFAANDGLFFCRMEDIRKYPVTVVDDPVLSRAKILDIYEDTKRVLWVVTLSHGIYKLDPEDRGAMAWKHFPATGFDHKGMRTGFARFIYEDIHGNIWFMAIEGLYLYDPVKDIVARHEQFTKVFPENVYQFTGDPIGYLWLVCDRGLVRYNPFSNELKPPRVYDSQDGMPYDDVHHAPLFTDSKGYIYASSWGGSGRGFFRFHPDSLKPENTMIPPIVLTDFKVSNKPFPLDTSITQIKHLLLKHNENFFSFEFAALDYFDPAKNQYAYKLEGLDEGWILSGNRRFANYTGIPPGNFIFRVKGSNNDGYWNEEGASVRLTIRKPPWKAWWAHLLYALFAAGVLMAITWYYIKRQQLRHALQIEQMQKKQLSEMDRMKSRFFANISHEFRTPLTLILGPIEKLKETTADKGCLEELNVMQRNARRLQRLIDQLLSLSKIEAGHMKLNIREENIVTFIQGYIQSFESAARQKGITLIFRPEQEKVMLYFDRDKMEKILFNLLSNAIKFTPEGGRVVVTVGGQPPPCPSPNLGEGVREGVVISVTDTGPGIPPEHLPRIFDRFYQADDSDSRFQEGTGIGLALVKELVELHHGSIEVRSASGEGTVFRVMLPIGKNHLMSEDLDSDNAGSSQTSVMKHPGKLEEGVFRMSDEKPAEPVSAKKMVILLVEDNPDMRYFIRSLLENNYQILEAVNGQDGLDTTIAQIPDLVVSDVMMPGMDGYELCRKLKNDLITCHIPVILLTSKVTMEDKLEGLDCGADDFVTKPFQPSELRARINNLVRQRQLLREKYRKEFEHVRLTPENSMSAIEKSFMEKVRKVVGENIGNPDFDIKDFSRKMNMSRVQLHRKLHALFNLSASEFIRIYRLNAAASLLEAKAGNVAQVAYEVGFNNLSYFSKCFHKQFGVKPSEYPKAT
jgi:signal transduction histidine kinase/ligand-binding sensor domain-containing protein/DNA-binding NarL/FixJ family response regulator